ncbi:MAG TPA: MFS transporter [Chloroflexi bacterium]|jgi:UMF1 family MFS transporter|nr:MFS transporter [Chloroflexota bacterium]
MATTLTDNRTYRRIVNAWCMYDWANSAFATTIMAALLPPYFSSVAAAGLPPAQATSIWAYSVSAAMLLVAVLGPVLGAIADYTGAKKRFMRGFLAMAVLFTGLLFFIQEGDWLGAVVFYVLASIGNAGANIFYDSLLPHVARPEDIDQVSTRGYALGYLGGGLLLLINLLWFMMPETFGFADSGAAVRASFLSVAVWWVIFSIPIFRHVPEPPASAGAVRINPVRAGFARLRNTLGEVRRYRELWKFLIAFWLYSDGIGTIIKMATIYGAEIGIGTADLAGALLLTQVVGVPLTFAFGSLARRLGTKRSIFLALGVYTLISIAGYFMSQAWHFWVLAGMVGTVQGGSQALSRSLFGAMTPKARSGEFYGFFDISSKFAGIAGPLLFGLTATIAGTSRWSIVSLVVFFVAGALLLSRVNETEGIAVARAADAAGTAEVAEAAGATA